LLQSEKFFRALQGAAPEELNLRALSEKYRGLYSAFKRGKATLSECLDCVRAGVSEASTVQGTDTRSQDLNIPQIARSSEQSRSSPDNESITVGNANVLNDEKFKIVGCDASWFREWLDSIPARERSQCHLVFSIY
jgi:hypothetical protein